MQTRRHLACHVTANTSVPNATNNMQPWDACNLGMQLPTPASSFGAKKGQLDIIPVTECTAAGLAVSCIRHLSRFPSVSEPTEFADFPFSWSFMDFLLMGIEISKTSQLSEKRQTTLVIWCVQYTYSLHSTFFWLRKDTAIMGPDMPSIFSWPVLPSAASGPPPGMLSSPGSLTRILLGS